MAMKLQNPCSISSSSNTCFSCRQSGPHFQFNKVVYLNRLLNAYPRHKCRGRHFLWEFGKCHQHYMWVDLGETYPSFSRSRRFNHLSPLASSDEGVTVNGIPQTSTGSDMEEMRVKLNQSLQGKDYSDGLIQSLHDAARVFELAFKEQNYSSKISWFSSSWLGVDKNAWFKTLSYQASVYSLLQAASEISARGDGRDCDVNVFVHRSLLRQSASLESLIREELSAKRPDASEWFWSEQLPMVVETFIDHFEKDACFLATITVSRGGLHIGSGNASDVSILILALTSIAAILKLGPAKVCCSQFFSMIPDVTGRLMDKLVELVPIRQAYYCVKDIGLCREFLIHFGPRAASCSTKDDGGMEEIAFWVELIQKQLQQTIDREKLWSKLTTCESIEVLEKDLAIFGFFIALGRSSKFYLSANGFDVVDDPIEIFMRYLIGGSVLYYPQLSSISSYQLYVEVVCEELEWLPFYPGIRGMSGPSHSHHQSKEERPPNGEAIPHVLDVCSFWMESFIKYSTWVESPSNIKAARFLSRGHSKLNGCMQELGFLWNDKKSIAQRSGLETTSGLSSSFEKELDSFDKALESVEEALKRLEQLLQEMHVSNSNSGKEHLKAACSDLERIRKLKKEAEFLEASFRAKEASLQQGGDEDYSKSSSSVQRQYPKREVGKGSNLLFNRSAGDGHVADRSVKKSRTLWGFLVPHSTARTKPQKSTVDEMDDERSKVASTVELADAESESNEIHRFERLRHELIELEKRVQKSTAQPENDEDVNVADQKASFGPGAGILIQVPKKENIIEKSIDKIKDASTDVWQGTQLLAIDVAAAVELLRRALIGDELTEKEKKALRRTLTDLASVVPIGILMLLPVTAVGHAAILAAIQRYVPALIPSTYGQDRLDLLRQLEKVKEMEPSEMNTSGNSEENSLSRNSTND
ncbi:hypothetical protein Syun_016657 [Stephania yunnanensis]|uniref:LETM1-like protein n=1 Tax=Stephania yunnanensis TaxID=152371 RepID=A0AAP0J735_9MAGN